LVGNLAMVGVTSSLPNRPGGDDQTEAHGMSGGLAVAAPQLKEDILFGARCAAYASEQFAAWVLPRWAAGQSSLLQEIGEDR
jgi:hypothetical protein